MREKSYFGKLIWLNEDGGVDMPRVTPHGDGPSPSSADRALALLEAFRPGEEAVDLRELAARASLTKSTAHRLLNILAARGFIESLGDGTYRLGLKVWEIGVRSGRPGSLVAFTQQYLEELAQASQETVHLSVRDGVSAVYIARITSLQRVAAQTYLGQRVPLYCTATGKALLAFAPSHVVDEILSGPLHQFSPLTVTDPDHIRQELENIRQCGYSSNLGQHHPELGGVAAPILGSNGEALAAFGIAGPIYRFTPDKITAMCELVKNVARSASLIAASGLSARSDGFHSPILESYRSEP